MKTANKLVMLITGLVFIAASIMKVHQLLTEPIVSRGFWESWLFFVIQIPLELGLGIWLVSGLFRKAAWLVVLLSFALFIGVTIPKTILGAESCGCFGRVHVDPRITLFAIDIPFFILLLLFRPKGYKFLPPPWPSARHFFGVAIPTVILLASIVPVLVLNKPPDKTEKYEVVKPSEWIEHKPVVAKAELDTPLQQTQKPFEAMIDPQPVQIQPAQKPEQWPLLKHIDIVDSLSSAISVVLLYHIDCPGCLDAIPLYDRIARDMGDGEDAIKFAFVEIPPYDTKTDIPIPIDTPCLSGKLDTSKDWIITTPLVVVLLDGVVIKSWEADFPNLEEILETVFQDS